jgi:hypothetical protein
LLKILDWKHNMAVNPKPAYIDPVTGSPVYGDYVSSEQQIQTEPMAASIGADGNISYGQYQPKTETDNMQAMRRLGQADYSVGAPGSTYAPGLAAAEAELTKNKTAYEAKMAQDAQAATTVADEAKKAADLVAANAKKVSAYDKLSQRLAARGLSSLFQSVKDLIQEDLPDAEFTIRLRETPAYQTRFSANKGRIAKGLKPLTEGAYLELEDAYQDTMTRYGLPESYYSRGDLGVQAGFEKLIAGGVSSLELEDRIQTAKDRVLNADANISEALKKFYPDITDGDVLAYVLDPKNAIDNIKRRVQAAEIGGAAAMAGGGVTTNVNDAEYLARFGITKERARTGYQEIAGGLERGGQLAKIYGQTPYTQTTAEQDVFGLGGAAEARRKRQKITGLEQATFGGQSGLSGSALDQGRAGAF